MMIWWRRPYGGIVINARAVIKPGVAAASIKFLLGKEAFMPINKLSESLIYGRFFHPAHVRVPKRLTRMLLFVNLYEVLLMYSTVAEYTRTSFRIKAIQATHYEQKKMQL
jgi:hypothetical protein